MLIAAIVAMGENRAIGRDNKLLWHLPDDLQHFKKLTLGKTVIMGRKTYESIGRPLPGRQNIILSRDQAFHAQGCNIVNAVDDALSAAVHPNVFIIGGETIYTQFLPRTTRIYLTEVKASPAGDVFFPVLDKNEWTETARTQHAADVRHAVPFAFVTLERI